jgi:PleD family two-component response regulator
MMDAELTHVSRNSMPGVEVQSRKTAERQFEAMRRKRVVVVDDDAVVHGAISNILLCLGDVVFTGKNEIDGLVLCEEQPCEFVLADLGMPAMDGLTLARHSRITVLLSRLCS